MICTKCTEPIDSGTVKAWTLVPVVGPISKKLLFLLCPFAMRYRVVVKGVAIEDVE